MTRSLVTGAGTGIVWAILVLMLVLSPTLGSVSSVLSQVLGLFLLPVLWRPRALEEIRRAPAQLMFIGAVALLTVLYAITARKPGDVLFFANFLSLPVSALLFVIALERGGRDVAILIARLCLFGAFVALLSAGFDLLVRDLPRAQGFVGNANQMPRVTLPLAFIGLSGIFLEQGWRRWLYLLAPLAGVVAALLTGSRGAALAIPVLGAIAATFMLHNRQTRVPALVGGAAIALLAALSLTFYSSQLLERFTSIAGVLGQLATGGASGDVATDERLAMYSAGIEAFQQSPWVGWGWANLGNAAAAIRPEAFANAAGTAFMFHNDVVNFAVAGGVFGLLCLAAMLAAPVVGALASPRDTFFAVRLYCCVALSGAYAVFGLTDSTLGNDVPTTLYAFLTAIVLGAFREPGARPS